MSAPLSFSADDTQAAPFTIRPMEMVGIVCFWGCIAALNIAQEVMEGPRPDGSPSLRPGQAWYMLIEFGCWAVVTPFVVALSARVDLVRREYRWSIPLHIGVAVLVASLADFATDAAWNALVTSSWTRTVSLQATLSGFQFLPELLMYLMVLSYAVARVYILRHRERLRETLELRAQASALEAQLAESKLRALRMQLNPHFLFNTLHTISSNLERDPGGMRRMISQLSGLLRYILDHSDANEVTLRQELSFLDGYLAIQQTRFADTLTIDRDIDDRVLDALVPNLVLQPIVENAIEHAVSVRGAGSTLAIRAWEAEGQLRLSVQDNGPGLPAASGDGAPPSSSGIGLRNTRARMETLYGEGYSLDLVPVATGGLDVQIALPYHTPYDLYTAAVPV